MPDFLLYIFIVVILAVLLSAACYVPFKAIVFLLSGKRPLILIPKYQFLFHLFCRFQRRIVRGLSFTSVGANMNPVFICLSI